MHFSLDFWITTIFCDLFIVLHFNNYKIKWKVKCTLNISLRSEKSSTSNGKFLAQLLKIFKYYLTDYFSDFPSHLFGKIKLKLKQNLHINFYRKIEFQIRLKLWPFYLLFCFLYVGWNLDFS